MFGRRFCCLLCAVLLCLCAPLCAADAENPVPVRCDEWHFSTCIPSGLAAYPYSWDDPEYGIVTGGGLVIPAEDAGRKAQVWILRRNHAFNNPFFYLTSFLYDALYRQDVLYEVTQGACLFEFGGVTLFGTEIRYIGDQDEELFREFRLIPCSRDGGVEFVALYAPGGKESALSLLDTVIRYYQPDEEPPQPEAAVCPLPQDPDLQNGTFMLKAEDVDKVSAEGYFTAALYMTDRYAAEDVRALRPGDTILINSRVYTVSGVDPWILDDGSWHEARLSVEEEAPGQSLCGFCFEASGDDYVLYVMNDWHSASRVASVRIPCPSAQPIAYYTVPGGMDPELLTADWLDDSTNPASLLGINPYNTTCCFRDGRLVRIDSASYPVGPVDPFIPVSYKAGIRP